MLTCAWNTHTYTNSYIHSCKWHKCAYIHLEETETETERLYLPVTVDTGRLIQKDTQGVPLNHRQQVSDGSVHV